ncbi:hypothetical protein EDB83DRAFT_2316375 [Lactarius deliciosus]|nr:hypothetical protein EDB83DRAFT_2316375 [Lactarius deliciosus]
MATVTEMPIQTTPLYLEAPDPMETKTETPIYVWRIGKNARKIAPVNSSPAPYLRLGTKLGTASGFAGLATNSETNSDGRLKRSGQYGATIGGPSLYDVTVSYDTKLLKMILLYGTDHWQGTKHHKDLLCHIPSVLGAEVPVKTVCTLACSGLLSHWSGVISDPVTADMNRYSASHGVKQVPERALPVRIVQRSSESLNFRVAFTFNALASYAKS